MATPFTGRISVNSPYGNRSSGFHWGIDLYGLDNHDVMSVFDGVVYQANDWKTGDYSNMESYGTRVIVQSKVNGRTIFVIYAHMNKRYVKAGQRVSSGTTLGVMGNTGNCYPRPSAAKPTAGTHLHFEVRVGSWRGNGTTSHRVNPTPYLVLESGSTIPNVKGTTVTGYVPGMNNAEVPDYIDDSSTVTYTPVTVPRSYASVRQIGYINGLYEPSINSSDIDLSIVNYLGMLHEQTSGYMLGGGDNPQLISTSNLSYNTDKLSSVKRNTITYLQSKGLNTAASVAICANIEAESNFNTSAVGDGGTSFGICQWHKGRGVNMKQYVGPNWATNLSGQLDFLIHELKSSYKGVWQVLTTVANNLEGCKYATDVFVRRFEVPENPSGQSASRQEKAEKIWSQLTTYQT